MVNNLKKRGTIITGGAGFIGSNLIKKLLDTTKNKIFVLDNLRLGKKINLPDIDQIEFIEVDLSIENDVNSKLNFILEEYEIEEVWHLAANSDIPAGTKDPNVDFMNTFLSTFNLLNAIKNQDLKKFHFASSSAIYGDHGNKKIHENTAPLFPISNYGSFKLASEAILSSYVEKNNCNLYIYRFPNVVGAPASHGVIFDFINRLNLKPGKLVVFGNGTQKKQYMHVEDLISAMLKIRSCCFEKRNIYNIGALDSGIQVSEIAELTVSMLFEGAEIEYGNENRGWIGDVPKYEYSIDKLMSINWSPKYKSSKEAVKKSIVEIYEQLKN